jgi:excisionase family DNA binding protein
MQDSNSKLFNHDEAADYINVSKRTLRTLVSRRLIPVIRLNARTLRFDRNAINAALAGLTISAR